MSRLTHLRLLNVASGYSRQPVNRIVAVHIVRPDKACALVTYHPTATGQDVAAAVWCDGQEAGGAAYSTTAAAQAAYDEMSTNMPQTNRPLNQERVEACADEMVAGRWLLTHQDTLPTVCMIPTDKQHPEGGIPSHGRSQ